MWKFVYKNGYKLTEALHIGNNYVNSLLYNILEIIIPETVYCSLD